MSIITSTAEQICNNPLNRSKSKSLYSFPKQKRFDSKPSYNCDKFYNIPDTKSKRFAGIGYSTKYDFTKGVYKTPAPGKYDIKSQIDFQVEKKIGKSIGESREVFQLIAENGNLRDFQQPVQIRAGARPIQVSVLDKRREILFPAADQRPEHLLLLELQPGARTVPVLQHHQQVREIRVVQTGKQQGQQFQPSQEPALPHK